MLFNYEKYLYAVAQKLDLKRLDDQNHAKCIKCYSNDNKSYVYFNSVYIKYASSNYEYLYWCLVIGTNIQHIL